MSQDLKIFTSPRQMILAGNETKEKKFNGNRTITIEGDKFSVELPDNKILTGTLTFQENEDGKDVYLTDTGCPFAISADEIVINLYRTHEYFITFDLRTVEPKQSFFKKLFG